MPSPKSSGFGAGMKIAMRDFEIRGAGDILGTQQSGQISSIGFHLYCKLLKRAIDALKQNSSPSFTETKMEFSFDACLPEDYINETSLRMEIYHRLGEASELRRGRCDPLRAQRPLRPLSSPSALALPPHTPAPLRLRAPLHLPQI